MIVQFIFLYIIINESLSRTNQGSSFLVMLIIRIEPYNHFTNDIKEIMSIFLGLMSGNFWNWLLLDEIINIGFPFPDRGNVGKISQWVKNEYFVRS